jgi:hypothetical protein
MKCFLARVNKVVWFFAHTFRHLKTRDWIWFAEMMIFLQFEAKIEL